MRKKTNKYTQKSNLYPLELPSRDSRIENAPIVDNVADNEVYPMDVFHSENDADSKQIAEVIAAEIDPEK